MICDASAQPTIAESFERSKTYPPTSKQAQDMNQAVSYFMAKDMMPYQTVEKPGFQHLMKKAVPQYKMPSRNFFASNSIPKMYNEVRASVQSKIAEGKWFSATTDLWTGSSGGGEPYISLTVHYLSPQWELHSHCLETMYFPEDHTADNIAEVFTNMLQEWNISVESLSGITTDNASNMKKAFAEFPCVWFSCFGHNLNLAISKVLKLERVDSALRACRHLVEAFSRSWKKKRMMKKKQAELDLPQHHLIHDVPTRWGSTFEMVSRFLEQQQAVCAVLAEDRGQWHLMPKDAIITTLEDVNQILTPLSNFTDALASETRVTLSSLKPVLGHITKEILGDKEEDSPLTKQMKAVMRDDLLQLRYSDGVKRVLDVSCFLDARFKESFSDNIDNTTKACVEEALKLHTPTVRRELIPSEEAEMSSYPTAKKDKSLSGLLKHIISSAKQSRSEDDESLEGKIKAEIRLYMSSPHISPDSDPLVWWKMHDAEMPLLSNVARKYLCISATSVPSERVFSSSGYILSPYRSRLSPENVNVLTFLHFNL